MPTSTKFKQNLKITGILIFRPSISQILVMTYKIFLPFCKTDHVS